MEELKLAIQSLAAIKTIAEGLIGLRDESKVVELKMSLFQRVIEVQQALIDVQQELLILQQENAAVHQENRLLKEQIRDAQHRKTSLEGYELFEPVPGVFVRAAEPLDGGRPQPPYLCQSCYDAGKKSTLGYQRATGRLEPATLQCPEHARHARQLPRGVNWDMLVQGIGEA